MDFKITVGGAWRKLATAWETWRLPVWQAKSEFGEDFMMDMERVVAELQTIRGEIASLREEMHRYRGFVGGVAWCMAALSGLVGFLWGMLGEY
ncbi:MAG: hypothetical protein EBQ80_06635 [Proteobacteria bacterium]|nr:hypothetical protein [Pseudomonadota bacterium]